MPTQFLPILIFTIISKLLSGRAPPDPGCPGLSPFLFIFKHLPLLFCHLPTFFLKTPSFQWMPPAGCPGPRTPLCMHVTCPSHCLNGHLGQDLAGLLEDLPLP